MGGDLSHTSELLVGIEVATAYQPSDESEIGMLCVGVRDDGWATRVCYETGYNRVFGVSVWVDTDASCSGRLAPKGDSLWVTTKVSNVGVNPFDAVALLSIEMVR